MMTIITTKIMLQTTIKRLKYERKIWLPYLESPKFQ